MSGCVCLSVCLSETERALRMTKKSFERRKRVAAEIFDLTHSAIHVPQLACHRKAIPQVKNVRSIFAKPQVC